VEPLNKKMRILILSFYFPPDIGPGPLRAESIVKSLIEVGPPNLKIDVLTTMPNRYHSFRMEAKHYETYDKVSIHRIKIPEHKNGMLDQVKSFILFSLKVRKFTFRKKWDVVFSTSGRLMTAALGTYIANKSGAKSYLDIRDLFTEAMRDLLKTVIFGQSIIIPLLKLIERWTFRSAKVINIVSPAFASHIKKVAPKAVISTYTNGIDEIFLKNNFIKEKTSKPIILYTGNIGEGQVLDFILPKLALKRKDLLFKVIGDGGAKKRLIDKVISQSIDNIEILKPTLRSNLINEYKEADILLVHLNDFEAFQKVLPSKIFEYAATGKPILAGVKGYTAKFFQEKIDGVQIFRPLDVDDMEAGLNKLLKLPKHIDRKEFCKLYSRKTIAKKLAYDVLELFKK
jgi:glycosyltransferase involved in cell wall biosynthesis